MISAMHRTDDRRRSRWFHVAAIAVFAGIAVILHLPGQVDGPSLDAAVFTDMAVGLRSGLLPYGDLWDHKPPGAYAAFALAQAGFPGADPWLGPWLLTIGACVLMAGLTYLLLLPVGWPWALVGGAVVAGYVSVYPVALGGGLTEPVATAAVLAAFGLAANGGGSTRVAVVCGILAGAAAATSLLGIPAILAVGTLVARPLSPGAGSHEATARRLGGFAFGVLLVVGVLLLLGAAGGILPEAWSALVIYNRAYGALFSGRLDGFAEMATASALFLAPLLVLCAVGMLRWLRTRRFDAPVAAAVAWVVGWSLAIAAVGRLEPHYLAVVIPPLVLMAVQAARGALTGPGSRRVAVVALVVVAIALAVPATAALVSRTGGYTNQPQVRAVADWLRARAAGSAGLFVWGDEPELYYTSGLVPATPYIYVLPLLTPGYGGPELSARVAALLAARPPQFVVDAGSLRPGAPGIVPLLAPRPAGGLRSLDTIDPIRQVVRDTYGPPVEVAGWLVYERLSATPVP